MQLHPFLIASIPRKNKLPKQNLSQMKYITLLAIILAFTGCFGTAPEKTGLEGSELPTFHLLLQDSSTWFASNHIPLGKPFIILYFSPRCPFCRGQIETIIKRMDKLKDIKFYLVTNFPISEIKQFSDEYKLTNYPNLLVGQDSANKIGEYFEISKIPYMAIYNKEKRLNKSFIGKIYASQIKETTEE